MLNENNDASEIKHSISPEKQQWKEDERQSDLKVKKDDIKRRFTVTDDRDKNKSRQGTMDKRRHNKNEFDFDWDQDQSFSDVRNINTDPPFPSTVKMKEHKKVNLFGITPKRCVDIKFEPENQNNIESPDKNIKSYFSNNKSTLNARPNQSKHKIDDWDDE